MGRAVAAIVCAIAAPASGSPAVSIQLGGSGGEVWASQTGWLRDDDVIALRVGVGLGRFVALDAGLSEDTARVEPAFGLGARVRLFAGPCWAARGSLFVRGQIALVAASHIGSNYDLLAGLGHWGGFADAVPWLHWFVELDGVTRVGEYQQFSARIELGLAFTTSAFWRD